MGVNVKACCVQTAKEAAEAYTSDPIDRISEAVSQKMVCGCGQGVKVTWVQDEDTLEDY